MATVETTVLLVAAEAREFDGIRRQLGAGTAIEWPGAVFAREVIRGSVRYWLVANGPGPRLVMQALEPPRPVQFVISTGFCGALDPDLRVGDVIATTNLPEASLPFFQGAVHSADRVAVTKEEKRELRVLTGASAVDMEAATVERRAREWGVPFLCIRVVSDAASDDMPLDFNKFRDSEGRFSRPRIAAAALRQPFTSIPALLRLNRCCRYASEMLGAFLANCRF
jgi:adenosylhomocysteine nucleosidase